MTNPRSVAELSHAVAAMLKAEINEKNRFASMDLCEEIMSRSDLVAYRDETMRQTLRDWIGKIQERFQQDVVALSEVPSVEELVDALRVHRSVIIEANEWRPLAKHVHDIIRACLKGAREKS